MITLDKQTLDAAKPHFFVGLAAVGVLYLVIFFSVFIRSSATLDTLDSMYASQTVEISKPKVSVTQEASKDKTVADAELIEAKDDALPAAPISGLFERKNGNVLPIIAKDGLSPFEAYKRPTPNLVNNKPIIAVVIEGYGLSDSISTKALSVLPADVSLFMSPYTNNANRLLAAARNNGHEVWMNVPFETRNYPNDDTGPQTLLQRSSLQLNLGHLEWAMSRATGYAGLYGRLDETFEFSEPMMKGLFQVIYKRGLGYLELSDVENRFVETVAVAQNQPYLKNVFRVEGDLIDQEMKWNEAVEHANSFGSAMIMISLAPKTLKILPQWLAEIEAQNIQLAPISAIYDFRWRG